ncbi:MAG: STAS domain-containing protein [Rhodospirillales bacterium]|nr:STAS domain-containing protein [Rhodospirillales bacterium]
MDNTHLISITEDFDAMSVNKVRPSFEKAARDATQEVTVDLGAVSFMDSSGIGAIVFLFKRLKERSIPMQIIGAKGQPLEILQFLRIDKTIPVIENKEAAQ